MPIVYVYRFMGTFRGTPEAGSPSPPVDSRQEGLAFVRHELDERDDALALDTCEHHGYFDVEILSAGRIQEGALQMPANASMVPLVRKALAEGRSLVWYRYEDQGSPSQ
jgi:hypothetical protein